MSTPEIDLVVYPDECDAFGHLNQASFLSLFERARWEMLRGGPGMDVFTRNGSWPALRRTVIDYRAAAFPGDVLRFQQVLTHHGRTSFTMRQTARRVRDDTLIAEREFVFVCIDREGRPIPVPPEFSEYMNARPGSLGGVQRITVQRGKSRGRRAGRGPRRPVRSRLSSGPQHLEGADRSAGGIPLYRADLRGMGQSDSPDLGYSMSIYASDLAALLDVLGVDDVVLCGHLDGRLRGFRVPAPMAFRVRGLVLMDTRAEADAPEVRRARDAAAATARERGAGAIADSMLSKMLAPATLSRRPEVAERVRALMARTPVAGLVGALAAMRDREESESLLPTLAGVPTLVVVGEGDTLTPPDQARAMADAIPGARLAVIPGAGHLPPVEQPEATTASLREFLASLG